MAMNMNKFLILGTGADINDIDFSKIDKSFITGGVNKIYKKIIPDYYYIYDMKEVMPEVPDEIEVVYTHPDKLYEYLYITKNYIQNFCTYYDSDYTPTFYKSNKEYECNQSSVNYLIRVLNDYLFKDQENVFYMVGVPLLENVGHFYEEEKVTTTQRSLDRFYNDFMRLNCLKYNLISLMKNSRLNKLFPVEDINLIYGVNNGNI